MSPLQRAEEHRLRLAQEKEAVRRRLEAYAEAFADLLGAAIAVEASAKALSTAIEKARQTTNEEWEK